jgi:hypothetical protein
MRALDGCVALTLLTPAFVLLTSSPASADCEWVEASYFTNGMLVTEMEMQCSGGDASGGSRGAGTGSEVSSVGSLGCDDRAVVLNVDGSAYCQDAARAPAAVTGPLVAAALRRISIPPAELAIQPPNGRTLVNFATNFYTDREEFTRTVRLLGQRVELRITPAEFTWHFDDGERTTTTTPGAPYPELEVTHEYLRKGDVHPRVDTTYTADYRVNSGAWQPVPGSVTIPGESTALEIVEATPVLVGYQ